MFISNQGRVRRVRIIDFDYASGEHQCRAVQRTYKLFELEPAPAELSCDELYDTAAEMDIWTPRELCPVSCSCCTVYVNACLRRMVQLSGTAGSNVQDSLCRGRASLYAKTLTVDPRYLFRLDALASCTISSRLL